MRPTLFVLLAVVAVAVMVGGWQVRDHVWDASAPVRFKWDIGNGMNWGARVLAQGHDRAEVSWETPEALSVPAFLDGYRTLYDELAETRAAAEEAAAAVDDPREKQRMLRRIDDRLDYAPLRLLVMSTWMYHVRQHDPGVHHGGDYRDELAAPLLAFNRIVGAAAGLLMFGFVTDWCRRCGASWLRACNSGLIAAALLWLNPALLLDAHAWPQWDVWAVPFYVGAVWAGSRNRAGWWLVAGLAIGIGAMLKGQILMASVALPVWALVVGGWRNVPCLLGGFVAAWAAITAVWLLDNTWAQVVAAVATVALATGLWFVPKVKRGDRWLAGIIGTGGIVFAAGYLFDGSFAWLTYGFANPTGQYPQLFLGPTSNVPALLAERFGFRLEDDVPIPWLGPQALRTVLITAGGTFIVLAGVLIGVQHRRRSTTLLVAVGLPWLAMFTLMPQMHERYLVWAAAISAAGAACSIGGVALHLGIAAAASVMIGHCLLLQDEAFAPGWLTFYAGTHPDAGWVVLVLMIAGFVMAVQTGGRPADHLTPTGTSSTSSAGRPPIQRVRSGEPSGEASPA